MWGGQSRGAGVVLAARPAYGVLPGSGRQFHGPLHWPVETSSASVSLLRMPSTPAVDRDVVAEAPRTVGCADEIDLRQRGRPFLLRLPESADGGNP